MLEKREKYWREQMASMARQLSAIAALDGVAAKRELQRTAEIAEHLSR